MSAVSLQEVHAGYGRDQDVLRGVNLQVPRGATVAILGPSGGGKSTILKAIAGLMPVRGRMEILDHPYPHRPPAGSVGYVPQRLGLTRHTSVLDNVVHGGLHETKWWQSLIHRAPDFLVERSRNAIKSVGLADKEATPIHRLSGGQQRRVAVARTLVQRPQLLLADEFLGELDPTTTDLVWHAVQQLQKETGMTSIFVEHQLDKARRFADAVYHLQDGILSEVKDD